jgi:hypothetical protein
MEEKAGGWMKNGDERREGRDNKRRARTGGRRRRWIQNR